MTERLPGTLRLASYNVHRCIGLDRRKDVARVAGVLREIDADVVALQEAEAIADGDGFRCQIEQLAEALGMTPVHGPTIVTHGGRYGNGLLTRHPVRSVDRLDLSHRRREPRGALLAELGLPAGSLRVACTHLGLRSSERAAQLPLILQRLDEGQPSVLIGDFNEWFPNSRVLRELFQRFGPMPRPATYPALRPLLALDRAFVAPRDALVSVHAHRSAASRVASDHLPLVALIDVHAPPAVAAAGLRS